MLNVNALPLAVLLSVVLVGCGKSEPPPKSSASGAQLFDHYCVSCHKAGGTGNFLKGIPANALTRLGPDEVVDLIRKGNPEKPKMPVFSNLSRYQAERITLHLWELRETLIEQRRR